MRFQAFASGWALHLWWLTFDWLALEDHWSVSLTWSRPIKVKPDAAPLPRG